jgi:hypothetical protein
LASAGSAPPFVAGCGTLRGAPGIGSTRLDLQQGCIRSAKVVHRGPLRVWFVGATATPQQMVVIT